MSKHSTLLKIHNYEIPRYLQTVKGRFTVEPCARAVQLTGYINSVHPIQEIGGYGGVVYALQRRVGNGGQYCSF